MRKHNNNGRNYSLFILKLPKNQLVHIVHFLFQIITQSTLLLYIQIILIQSPFRQRIARGKAMPFKTSANILPVHSQISQFVSLPQGKY